MQLKDIMTTDVEVTCPDCSLKEAAETMREFNIGSLPVCDGDRLVGYITDRDIAIRCAAEGCDPSSTKVSDIMTEELIYCFEDQDVREAARIMEEKQIRRLPILNRNKELVGIVSLGDLAVRVGEEKLAGEAIKKISEPSMPLR